MSIPPAAAAAIAITGNFILSLGMAFQKRHVGWIGKKRPWGRPFYHDLAFWFLGFMLVNIVPAFQYLALTGLTTNVVAATAGTSIAFTAILAKLMLKERIGSRRLAWSGVLFAAIAAAGFLGEGGSSGAKDFSPWALFLFLGIPFVAGPFLFIARRSLKGPRLAATLAAVSGCLSGFMVFPLRALQVAAGDGIVGWLVSPYLYTFFVAGISSLVLIQTAYKDGEMAAIAPAFYGMQVLWPALASYFVFGTKFMPIQTAAFALVAVCVAVIAGVHPVAKTRQRRPRIAKTKAKKRGHRSR